MPHRDERKPPPGAARRRPSAVTSQPPHDPPSQNGSIRPKRPIHTSLLGAAAANGGTTTSVDVGGKITTSPDRDWLDYLQVLGVFAALGSLILIRRQLVSADRAARQERAAEHAAVWTNREYLKILSPFWSFIEVKGVDGCIEKVKAWVRAPHSEDRSLPGAENGPHPCKNDINHVIGVIEDVAVRYNRRAVDRDWVERVLGPALVTGFDRCLWFMVFFRVNEDWESVGAEWQKMVRDLRESRQASVRTVHLVRRIRAIRTRCRQRRQGTYTEITRPSSQKIRVICLPPDPKTASDTDWDRARELSADLAAREASILGSWRKPADKREAPSKWKAIVIPRSIDSIECEKAVDARLSRKLNEYLGSQAP